MTTTAGPVTAVRPDSLAAAVEAMRDLPAPLRIAGGGTKAHWGGRAPGAASVVETVGLAGITRYDPDDATVAVRAGTRIRDLQDHLSDNGQRLALDCAYVDEGATVGGVLATGDAGPARLRYGTLRDLAIGVTLVLTDGAVGRAGGHVIKNVAGYDLTRLAVGSLGTLGLVAEVVLRVHPLPPATVVVRIAATSAAAAWASTRAVLDTATEPTAIDWDGDAVWVRLEGRPGAVDARARTVVAALAALDVDVTVAGDDPTWPAPPTAAVDTDVWSQPAQRDAASTVTVARAGALPDRLPAVAAGLADATTDGIATTLRTHTAVGVTTAGLRGPATDHAAAVARWREQVRAVGGHVTVIHSGHPTVVPWGPPGDDAAWAQAIKDRFDPAGRLVPGRLPGVRG